MSFRVETSFTIRLKTSPMVTAAPLYGEVFKQGVSPRVAPFRIDGLLVNQAWVFDFSRYSGEFDRVDFADLTIESCNGEFKANRALTWDFLETTIAGSCGEFP